LLSHLGAGVDRILARARQVANRLVGRIRNPHRAQFPRTGKLGQPQAIPVVGLDAVPSTLRDQRGCNYLAVIAPPRQFTLQSISGGPGLIDHLQASRLTVTRQQFAQFRYVVRDAAEQPCRRPPGFRDGHRDRVLVHIQADDKLDTRYSGRRGGALDLLSVMRHADAGYAAPVAVARAQGLDMPML